MTAAHARRSRLSGVFVWGVLCVLVLVVATTLVGFPALMAYDRAHPTTITCTVSEVDAGKSSASAKGAATTLEVFIDTKDCGELSLQWGLTKENLEATADQLVPGERYVFEIGEGSKHLMGLLHALDITPSVRGFDEAQ